MSDIHPASLSILSSLGEGRSTIATDDQVLIFSGNYSRPWIVELKADE